MFLCIALVGIACALLRVSSIPFLPTPLHSYFDRLRNYRTEKTILVSGYEITLVQVPSVDFYESYCEVRRSGNSSFARIMIDADDNKWRDLTVLENEGFVHFCDGDSITSTILYVDRADLSLHLTSSQKSVRLQTLTFNNDWRR
jgi:hypothetical protein